MRMIIIVWRDRELIYILYFKKGLDSSTSLQVAECLANIAQDMRKTVICTIHSPSLDMLCVWDNLYLMSAGRLVYSGAINEVHTYFQALGHHPRGTDNPVEFALELLADDATAMSLTSSWKSSEIKRPTLYTVENTDSSSRPLSTISKMSSLAEKSRSELSILQQIRILTHRHALYTVKCIHGLAAMLLRNIAAGVAFGILYFKSGKNMLNEGVLLDVETRLFTADCMNMQALQFLVIIYVIVINIIAVPSMCGLHRLYKREQV